MYDQITLAFLSRFLACRKLCCGIYRWTNGSFRLINTFLQQGLTSVFVIIDLLQVIVDKITSLVICIFNEIKLNDRLSFVKKINKQLKLT